MLFVIQIVAGKAPPRSVVQRHALRTRSWRLCCVRAASGDLGAKSAIRTF